MFKKLNVAQNINLIFYLSCEIYSSDLNNRSLLPHNLKNGKKLCEYFLSSL